MIRDEGLRAVIVTSREVGRCAVKGVVNEGHQLDNKLRMQFGIFRRRFWFGCTRDRWTVRRFMEVRFIEACNALRTCCQFILLFRNCVEKLVDDNLGSDIKGKILKGHNLRRQEAQHRRAWTRVWVPARRTVGGTSREDPHPCELMPLCDTLWVCRALRKTLQKPREWKRYPRHGCGACPSGECQPTLCFLGEFIVGGNHIGFIPTHEAVVAVVRVAVNSRGTRGRGDW